MATRTAKTPTGIRKLNTKIYDDNGHFAVQLYSTVVYDQTADKLILNNGGWATATTASRINQALDYKGVKGGVNVKGGQMYFTSESLGTVPFVDGRLELILNAGQVA